MITWKDLEGIMLIEISQTEKAKYHMISLIWGIKNMTQMNLFTKQKQTHRLRKKPYGYRRGKVREKDKLGVWDWPIYTNICQTDNQKGPAEEHKELCWKHCHNLYGKRTWKRTDIRLCITESRFCTPKTNTTLEINSTSL